MDQTLFFLINRQWTSPALDRLMAAASSFDLWLPVIVLAAVLTAWLGGKRARLCLAALALTLVVGDGLVSGPLKHAVHRLRPFQAMAGVRQVDLARRARPRALGLFQPLAVSVTAAPAVITADNPFPGRSFPSSHVLNNFCAAAVLTFFYRRRGALYFLPAAPGRLFAHLHRVALAERRGRFRRAGGGKSRFASSQLCIGWCKGRRPVERQRCEQAREKSSGQGRREAAGLNQGRDRSPSDSHLFLSTSRPVCPAKRVPSDTHAQTVCGWLGEPSLPAFGRACGADATFTHNFQGDGCTSDSVSWASTFSFSSGLSAF